MTCQDHYSSTGKSSEFQDFFDLMLEFNISPAKKLREHQVCVQLLRQSLYALWHNKSRVTQLPLTKYWPELGHPIGSNVKLCQG